MKVEKKSKYFLNLQKGHLKNGVVSPLQLGDKEISSLEKEILSQCETWNEMFIVPKQTLIIHELTTYFLETLLQNHWTLRIKCEGMFTKAECLQGLKTIKPCLPKESYKVFWNEIYSLRLYSRKVLHKSKMWDNHCSILIALDFVSTHSDPFYILFLVFHWLKLLRKGWKYKGKGGNHAWFHFQGWSNCLPIRY